MFVTDTARTRFQHLVLLLCVTDTCPLVIEYFLLDPFFQVEDKETDRSFEFCFNFLSSFLFVANRIVLEDLEV